MIGQDHGLTLGYVQRHLPPGSRAQPEIAILDIAQDFLLAHLHTEGLFDSLITFKGGTALRKLFAGAQGRFSTDIDLAANDAQSIAQSLRSSSPSTAPPRWGPFASKPPSATADG